MAISFQVGDRVKCVQEFQSRSEAVGKCGTVVIIPGGQIGVEFDEYVRGHNLNGRCKDGHGWFFPTNRACLELLVESSPDFEPSDMSIEELLGI